MSEKPKKGIFKDPWRTSANEVTIPQDPAHYKPSPLDVEPVDSDNDKNGVQHVSVALPNYGGITVGGTNNSQELGRRLLEFCVVNQKIVEPYLLQYGIVVVKLGIGIKLNTLFYIQRSDGWTLAVPEVSSREQGLLQLIQAFLELANNPSTQALLAKANIRPYKQ